MAIPEGFTRAQLGLPEDDNLRTVEGSSEGLWHIVVGMRSNPKPATVFDSKVTKSTSVYIDGYFADDQFAASRLFGTINILEAPDEAVAALRWAGYEFIDGRKPS